MTLQEQFAQALATASADLTFVCKSSDERAIKGASVDGVTISKSRHVPMYAAQPTADMLRQAVRTLLDEMAKDADTGVLTSCFVPADIWDDATELFTLRDEKTQAGFNVFSYIQLGVVQIAVAASWGPRGR